MRKCVQRAVHALLFTCISLKVKAQTCDLDLALGQEWTDESGVKTIATQLNFTGDGIPAPWSFELEGDFEAGVIPWDWSVTSRSSEKVAGIVPGYWQYVNQTPVALGALISFTGDASNLNVSLNGQECAVNVSEIQLGTPTASVEGSTSPQPMKTLNGQLLGVNGEPVKLVGVNWFGWTNDQTSFFDGLWQGPSSLTLDYATVVYRLQLLGVNAVRIVFSFDNIFNGTPTSLATSSCPVAQQSDIQKSVTDPSMSVNDGTIPPPTVQLSQPTGTCNAYIPSDTVLDAFVTAIRILTSNGMYIILDNQSQSDNTVIENTPQWVKYWSTLMETLWQQPETAAYVIVDAFNEPDFFNLKFEPVGGLPGARALYIQVWDAIYAVAPNTVFGFEGLGQGAYVQNWGNGLVTDASIIASTGISDPNPFFQEMLSKPYVDQLVAIPHVYGPSVSLAQSGYSGAQLYQMLSNSLGYLNKQGYCYNGKCQKFPVLLGETGFDPTNSGDTAFIASLANYINAAGDGDDGLHAPLSGALLWCFNQNTNGNLQLLQADWATLEWDKVDWLRSIGLTPWYAPKSTSASSTPPSPSSGANTEGATTTRVRGAIDQNPGLQMRGLFWSGFETNDTGLAGTVIGEGPVALSDPDFATNVQAIYALGFDTVVLPFTFEILKSAPEVANTNCAITADQFKEAITPANITYAVRPIPTIPYQITGDCNDYLPKNSTLDRFYFVVDYLVRNGFYVVLQNVDIDLATTEPESWVTQMVYLMTGLSSTEGVVVDPLRAGSLTFESTSNRPGLSDLYLTVLDALDAVAPDLAGYLLEVPETTGISPAFLQILNSKTYSRSVLFAQKSGDTINNSVTIDLDHESFDSYIDESFSKSSGWIWDVRVDVYDAVRLLEADLKPWFLPPSPNRTASYSKVISNEPLQIAPALCQVEVSTLAAGISDNDGPIAVLEFVVKNMADTTVFPPWRFDAANESVIGVTQSYGLTGTSVASGKLSGHADRYWQTLWPAASNNQTLQIVFKVVNVPNTFETMLNGDLCDTIM